MRSDERAKESDNSCFLEKPISTENIWDATARTNHALSVPEWQKAELDKRYDDYKNGKSKLHAWQGVHEKPRDKCK
uniref:Putative addiction module component, TIGR02574 family n=1 Tax=Candidatus Kentrum sp. LFY TaxID=2126342 RepID=A0A450UJM2_9GAMM|nr:MAG: putative addiction module component, TIGR02574 family [Candidatus Kentron sp. LFY]VFJ96543.1 MAG: putative addiction module component, TIGR02574 family [Candidatus Kentron sp. LFY]